MTTTPKCPTGLSKRSRDLWSAVLADYDLGPAELEVLRGALVSLDRADEAAEVLKTDGLSTVDRYGSPKAHPLLQSSGLPPTPARAVTSSNVPSPRLRKSRLPPQQHT